MCKVRYENETRKKELEQSINMLHKIYDKMQTTKGRFSVPLVAIALSTGLFLSLTTIMYNNHLETTAQQQESPDLVTIQNTSMSAPAPNSAVNKSMPHQIVVALPLRQGAKIWTGTVTFTASKPIEVEVEHKYNPKVIPDGAPYNAKWIDNTTRIALSPMTMFSNTPVAATNTPISTGSFVFTGSALLFHKTDGIPFTVTYTIDAVAKPLTQK